MKRVSEILFKPAQIVTGEFRLSIMKVPRRLFPSSCIVLLALGAFGPYWSPLASSFALGQWFQPYFLVGLVYLVFLRSLLNYTAQVYVFYDQHVTSGQKLVKTMVLTVLGFGMI